MKANKVWLGYIANKTCVFRLSDEYTKWDEKITEQMNDGHKYGKCPAISVFTNLDIAKRHEKLILWKHYTPEEYLRYDNYDAIEVSKVSDIPVDYDGVMGVPITFMAKYNPDQFEILDINPHFFMEILAGKSKPRQLSLHNVGRTKDPYARILIRARHPH